MIGPHTSFDPSSSASTSCQPLVCVVGHQPPFREQLCHLFRGAHLPVRAFVSGSEFLNHPHHPGPCCLVAEMQLPDRSGPDLLTALAGRAEQMVFLSEDSDVLSCARAMKAGAVDFFLKPADDRSLLEAVARGLARSQSVHTTCGARSAARSRFESLTTRELEVMHRVIAGRLNKQTAAELGIAEKTIKIHRGRAMHKLGIESVADLVRLAMLAEIE